MQPKTAKNTQLCVRTFTVEYTDPGQNRERVLYNMKRRVQIANGSILFLFNKYCITLTPRQHIMLGFTDEPYQGPTDKQP